MTGETAGAALIGRVLAQLASEPPCTAVEMARRLGAARTTTFEVLRQLEDAGFVERDAQGNIAPGGAGAALGFASLGLAAMAGTAEALLPVLRDGTDAQAELVVRHGGRDVVLVQRSPAGWTHDRNAAGGRACCIEAPIDIGRGVLLRLSLRAKAGAEEQEAARRSLETIAGALARCCRSSLHDPGNP